MGSLGRLCSSGQSVSFKVTDREKPTDPFADQPARSVPPAFWSSRAFMSASAPAASAGIEAKVKAAKEKLDAHAYETVQWHFHESTGCPFWLERAKSLKFNPFKEIKTFDDIKKFDLFEDEWLRGGPVRRWVPKALADKPIYVFETGGTTGIPKSRIAVGRFPHRLRALQPDASQRIFSQGLQLADAWSLRPAAAAAGRRALVLSIAAASASASIWIRAGSSSSSRKVGWSTWRPTSSIASIRR